MSKIRLILINASIALFLFVVIELLIRVFVTEIQPLPTSRNVVIDRVYATTPGLKPNSEGISMGKKISVDEKGFWSYSNNGEKEKSWLLLGDSVTMGMGVDPDSSYAGRMATYFDSVSVLNTAFIGFNSTDYRNISDSDFLFEKNSIERIILFWCLNDLYPDKSVQFQNDESTTESILLTNSFMNFVRNNFFTYQWLKKNFFDRSKKYYQYDSSLYDKSNEDYKSALKNIAEIKKVSDSLDVELSMFLLPYEYQIRNKSNSPQNIFKNDLKKLGIEAVNLYPYFKDETDISEDFFLYGDGIHFSTKGHSEIFKAILESKEFLSNE